MKNISTLLILACLFMGELYAQEDVYNYSEHFKDVPASDLLILGSFHFKDAGLDGYKPEYDINIKSDKKQQELQEVIKAILKYGPTKVAVEVKRNRHKRIDSLYNEYLNDRYELGSNEIYQIGFRVAKLLGHQKVYAVDAPSRGYFSEMTEEELVAKEQGYIKKADQKALEREAWLHKKFMSMYAIEDKQKTQITLLEQFLYMNEPSRLLLGHGHYIIGSFKMGEGEDDYFGADSAMWWYNRNIRIFQNLLQIQESHNEKIFLLIGAGHVPIIDFLAGASPDFNKKSLKDYID